MTNKITVYTASDYSGLTTGKFGFYYGYEETLNDEWCFVAKEDNKEVMRLVTSELESHMRNKDEVPELYLLTGIGLFLSSRQ